MNLTPYILPTKDPALIYMNNHNGMDVYRIPQVHCSELGGMHLYLCSSEEIKEGDWFIMNCCILRKCALHKGDVIDTIGGIHHESVCKKIELTTDPKLISEGVGKIDGHTIAQVNSRRDEAYFLTEFCKRWNDKGEAEAKGPFSLSDMKKVAIGLADWTADQIIAGKRARDSEEVFNDLVKSLSKPNTSLSISYNTETRSLTIK